MAEATVMRTLKQQLSVEAEELRDLTSPYACST